jgi:hypothetical protein
VPPLIVAAKAIPNNLDANTLLPLSKSVIEGLLTRGVLVLSYACDGTEVERSVQRLIITNAPRRIVYRIQHPVPGMPDITIAIAQYGDRLLVMIQDSKHALKTYRNNLFTGCRLLVLGSYVAMYSYARAMAFEPGAPLYHRHVEKMDRQDDNAATALFSSAALKFLAKTHPERLGQVVYLFVFGELVDAYQNRQISHRQRIKIALRARFFLDIWREFLAKAGYPENRHFISREAADISRIVIEGLISLIIAHRDYMDGEIYPLLPWLHSSETCEHIFAECRKLIKDFTFLDFLYMVPRLHMLIRYIIKSRNSSDPKAQAAGYAHTYFDSSRIDLAQLSIFPTDAEIEATTKEAWEEANSLFVLLGVSPSDLKTAESQPEKAHLPSINSWFGPGQDPLTESIRAFPPATPVEEISDNEDEFDFDGDDETDAATLQKIIDDEKSAPFRNSEADDRMLALTCAAVAVNVDESMFV